MFMPDWSLCSHYYLYYDVFYLPFLYDNAFREKFPAPVAKKIKKNNRDYKDFVRMLRKITIFLLSLL